MLINSKIKKTQQLLIKKVILKAQEGKTQLPEINSFLAVHDRNVSSFV